MNIIIKKLLTDNLIEAIKAMREITEPTMRLKEAKEFCELVRDGRKVEVTVPDNFNPNTGYANCFLFENVEYRQQYILEQYIRGNWVELLREDIPSKDAENMDIIKGFCSSFDEVWDTASFYSFDKTTVITVNRADGPLRARIR